MKTIKHKFNQLIKPAEIKEVEKEYIDRPYYIETIRDKLVKEGKLVLEVSGGVLQEVYNCPEGGYHLIDWDDLKEGLSEEEFKEFVEENGFGDE